MKFGCMDPFITRVLAMQPQMDQEAVASLYCIAAAAAEADNGTTSNMTFNRLLNEG
jgi:hypothetical protein